MCSTVFTYLMGAWVFLQRILSSNNTPSETARGLVLTPFIMHIIATSYCITVYVALKFQGPRISQIACHS